MARRDGFPFDGDEDGFAEEYSRLVRRVVRPFYLRGGDYDDLYQEGMIGLLKAMRGYDPVRKVSFETFAVRCIKNCVYDAIRKAEKQPQTNPYSALDSAEQSAHDIYQDPETEVLANESAKEIQAALSGLLSPFEASVLDLYLGGYTASEIAGDLQRPVKSVDNAIWRIRRKLAQYLSQGRLQDFPCSHKTKTQTLGTKER